MMTRALRVGVLVAVTVQLLTFVPAASARAVYRQETQILRYGPADVGVGAAVARVGLFAVEFAPPYWAQSAEITVRDETAQMGRAWGAVEFWVGWGATSSTHCSHKGNSTPSEATLRAARVRAQVGNLLVQPLVGQTLDTCPVPFVSVPTTGTITVTFSSRVA